MPIDFAKIKADMKAKAEREKAAAPDTPIIRQPKLNWFVRINILLEVHRGVLTEWETNFLYDTKSFIIDTDLYQNDGDLDRLDLILTSRVKNKIAEIENQCEGR